MRPYDLYTRFLVTKGITSVDELNSELERLGLQPYTQDEFQKIYNHVHNTVTRAVSDQIVSKRYHGEFYRWMKVLDVAPLWDYEKPFFVEGARVVRLCYDIHQDPQLRLTLHSLLLKGCKHNDICQDLAAKFSTMIKPVHVEIYDKYFWNVRRMSRKDWRAYLKLCSEHETSVLFTALTESLDVVRTMLDLPARVSISDSLQHLYTMSYMRAKRYLRLDQPDANDEARRWIKVVLELADKYAKHRTGDTADFSKTLQMEFEYVEEDFPTPDDAVMNEIRERQKVSTEDKEDKSTPQN